MRNTGANGDHSCHEALAFEKGCSAVRAAGIEIVEALSIASQMEQGVDDTGRWLMLTPASRNPAHPSVPALLKRSFWAICLAF